MAELMGWAASTVLIATILSQIHKQWHQGTSKGVSMWLFVGQAIASILFTIYSVMLRNYVFIVTNTLMALSALVGLAILVRHRRRGT